MDRKATSPCFTATGPRHGTPTLPSTHPAPPYLLAKPANSFQMAVSNVTALAYFGYPESIKFENRREAHRRIPGLPPPKKCKRARLLLVAERILAGEGKALDQYWN